jgi:hypothetical protein
MPLITVATTTSVAASAPNDTQMPPLEQVAQWDEHE